MTNLSEAITYRKLEAIEAEKLREIDRSEHIDAIYYLRDGALVLEPEVYNMTGFPPGELDSIVAEAKELLERGGTVFGAFAEGKLVGAGSVECKFIGSARDTLQMPILQTIAGEATPSKHTVHFYQRMGCTLASEVDPLLFEKEPEDIHLELILS